MIETCLVFEWKLEFISIVEKLFSELILLALSILLGLDGDLVWIDYLSEWKSWLIWNKVMIDRKSVHDLIWFEVIIYPNGSQDWSGMRLWLIVIEALISLDLMSWLKGIGAMIDSDQEYWLIRIKLFIDRDWSHD